MKGAEDLGLSAIVLVFLSFAITAFLIFKLGEHVIRLEHRIEELEHKK